MKRFFLGVLGLAALVPCTASALTIETKDTILANTNHVVSDTYMVAGGTIDLAGTYDNDVIAAGGTITISGPVKGDVLVAGGTIKITGPVDGSIRAFGGTIEVNGVVGRNVNLVGGTLLIDKSADVRGEALVAGGTLTLNGKVGGGVSFGGGNAIVNGTIIKDAVLQTGDDCGGSTTCVVVGPSATIGGNLEYWAAQAATIQSGAKIAGETIHHPLKADFNKKTIDAFLAGFKLWKFLAGLVFGLAVVLLFPAVLRSILTTMTTRMGTAVGFGALFTFATPIGLLILAVTLIGIPLAVTVGGWFAFLFMIANVLIAIFFGEMVWRAWRKIPTTTPLSRGPLVAAVTIGMILLSLVFDFLLGVSAHTSYAFVAFLGGLLKLGLTLWAFGALVLKIGEFVRTQK